MFKCMWYICRVACFFVSALCPPLDVLIVLDASGSLHDHGGDTAWPAFKNFVKAVIRRGTRIGRSLDHVALVQFSNMAFLRFDFNRYSSMNDVLAAVDRLQWIGLETDTSQALDLGRRVFLESRYGSRSDATHIMLLITDLWMQPEQTWTGPYNGNVTLLQATDIHRFCKYKVHRYVLYWDIISFERITTLCIKKNVVPNLLSVP